jgi:prohibitin 1
MAIADSSVATRSERGPRQKHWYQRHQLRLIAITFFFFFAVIVLWPYVFVVIPSGHAGVYYSLLFGGTDVKWVRLEGFQFKLPWDTIFDYDIRLQQLAYKYSVISADGLILDFNISVRCQPKIEALGLLQQQIGPDYVEKVVIPETQTALRVVVGGEPIDQIYSTNVNNLQDALTKAVARVSGKYIRIDTILITDIEIPDAFRRAIEAKISQQQNSLQYDYVLAVAQKEAERKRIEAQGIRDFQAIVSTGISPNYLRWRGIEATLDLAKSSNAKVVVIGAQNGLPLILDTSTTPVSSKGATQVPLLPGIPPEESVATPTPTPESTPRPTPSLQPVPLPYPNRPVTRENPSSPP